MLRGRDEKIIIGITGLREILGRDYRIEEFCWEPSLHEQLKIKYNILHWNRSQEGFLTEITAEKVNEPSLTFQKLWPRNRL